MACADTFKYLEIGRIKKSLEENLLKQEKIYSIGVKLEEALKEKIPCILLILKPILKKRVKNCEW